MISKELNPVEFREVLKTLHEKGYKVTDIAGTFFVQRQGYWADAHVLSNKEEVAQMAGRCC